MNYGATLGVHLPAEDPVPYRGVVNYDDAGLNSGAMVYVAPDAVSFLAALFTHGVLNESVKKGQRSKLEEAADQVLVPYNEVLSRVTHRAIWDEAKGKMAFSGRLDIINDEVPETTDWQLKLLPVFSMTQDQSSIILDNAVFIVPPGMSGTSAKQYIIRVVSQPSQESNLPEYWMRDEGRNLFGISAYLLAQSLDIALQDAAAKIDTHEGQERTVRYREGKKEKMERGRVITEDCSRILIRNLRGWLMSVPPSTRLEPCDSGI